MRDTANWAFFRRLQYLTFFALVAIFIIVWAYFRYFYVAENCFDGEQGTAEAGVDCGGDCVRICAFQVNEPSVQWARSFKIADGQYNAVAYIENTNQGAATPELRYTFSFYDESGLITTREGTTILPPDSVYPIFEGRIFTDGRVPTRTLLDLEAVELWQPSSSGREQFTVINRELEDIERKPRLDAVLENTSLEAASQVEVVATIFDANGNALTSSQTYVDDFAPRAQTQVVFTWPEPIAKTLRSCSVPTDVVIAIDLSGSMNNDNDAPPEPISSVLAAATNFTTSLNSNDRAAVVTFATESRIAMPLIDNIPSAARIISGLTIDPEEEVGNTNTGAAFFSAYQAFLTGPTNVDARQVLVLLTDGLATAPEEEPEQFAIEQAAGLRATGVEIYTIGLGEEVNMDFVRAVSSDNAHAYQALTKDDVEQIYQDITGAICEDGAAVIDVVPKSDAGFILCGKLDQWQKARP